MEMRKQYHGLDVVKFFLAVLVAERHVVQIFFDASSKWRVLLNNWMSNLAVPVFFIIAGFFLFQKTEVPAAGRQADRQNAGENGLMDDGHDIGEGRKRVYRYCGRILRMYLIWSLIYLPIDLYNWYHGERIIGEGVLGWLHSFLFCSTIPQLWYLPALALASFLVWAAYSRGIKPWQILAAGAVLLICGYLGDNWYYNQNFPQKLQELLALYRSVFLTPRNGVFYGIFYVALGLFVAKTTWRLPFWGASAGFLFFFWCMYREVMKISDPGSNTNFVLFAAPAAYCLFTAASAVNWKPRKVYERLRGMSQWIYLSHFYFFYFLNWLRPWNPVPFNSKTVTVMILVQVLLFSWCMVRLSETAAGNWLKKLI